MPGFIDRCRPGAPGYPWERVPVPKPPPASKGFGLFFVKAAWGGVLKFMNFLTKDMPFGGASNAANEISIRSRARRAFLALTTVVMGVTEPVANFIYTNIWGNIQWAAVGLATIAQHAFLRAYTFPAVIADMFRRLGLLTQFGGDLVGWGESLYVALWCIWMYGMFEASRYIFYKIRGVLYMGYRFVRHRVFGGPDPANLQPPPDYQGLLAFDGYRRARNLLLGPPAAPDDDDPGAAGPANRGPNAV